MKIGVPKETAPSESRVALVPETVRRLTDSGHQVLVESGAGFEAGFPDSEYTDAGAEIVGDSSSLAGSVDLLVHLNEPTDAEIAALNSGAVVIGQLAASNNPELVDALAARGATALSMELVPRIARAQRMDVLSSQASIAGYKAVLIAAAALGKYMPMMMTAAGTIPPARVLILGAGVAGLQAIATAGRLGAVVEAYDVRPVVKEQVESLGAKFIEVPQLEEVETAGGYAREQTEEEQDQQRALLAEHVATADIVITTAAIPGRPAPLLITADMVAGMNVGSVIVDLAAESGGNVEVTQAGETTVTDNGVEVHGPINVPGTVPKDASRFYSRNLAALFELIIDDEGNLHLDFEDEVIDAMCVAHAGEPRNGLGSGPTESASG